MKSYFRALQTFLPFLQNARFRFERAARRATRSVHDSDWLAFPHFKIGKGPILDVGANRGQSIESFRIVLPGREIIAFEPNSHLAGMLKRDYLSDSNIRIEAVALSDRESVERLYIPRYRNWVFDGLASMDRREAMDWLNGDRLKGFDPTRLTCIEMDIVIKTLDKYLVSPSVLKLDTQGTEEKVLRGGMSVISTSRPVILVESATPEIAKLLKSCDYMPFAYERGKLVANRLDSKNVFFVTREHLK